MWYLSWGPQEHDQRWLFSSLPEMLDFMDHNDGRTYTINFIRIYTKPEKVEGKERNVPLVPLSRAKQD